MVYSGQIDLEELRHYLEYIWQPKRKLSFEKEVEKIVDEILRDFNSLKILLI